MATQNQSNQPTNTPSTFAAPSRKEKKTPIIPIAITGGVILLAVIAFLAFSNINKNRALTEKINDLESAEAMMLELEETHAIALSELEDMRTENDELNATIAEHEYELEQQKKKISRMIRQKKDLSSVKDELAKMKEQVDGYLAEIEELKLQNEELMSQNEQLAMNNEELQANLNNKQADYDELNDAQAVLVSEKSKLEAKVGIASVIKVDDVQVKGLRVKGSGKAVEKKTAKQVTQLQVTFNTTINEVVAPGLEQFYVRIINPIGETLSIEDLGSGMMTNTKTNEQVLYTQIKEYDYANDETTLSFVWDPKMPFQRGHYEVEVYNKGYLAGTGGFDLK